MFDPAEPFHRDGLDEDDFPEAVLERIGADAGDPRWWLWRLPEPLLAAVTAVPEEDLGELAARWARCRVVFLFRGSYDLGIKRPPPRTVLDPPPPPGSPAAPARRVARLERRGLCARGRDVALP